MPKNSPEAPHDRQALLARWLGATENATSSRVAFLVIMSVAAILVLGAVRVATAAEFAFASLAMFPVLTIAWVAGPWAGFAFAILATSTWLVGDLVSAREYRASWVPWANASTRLLTYSIVAVLTATVHDQLKVSRALSMRDPLTGLANRRAVLEQGSKEVERSRRYAHPMALVSIDLDHFKALNDREGHQAGDLALCATARSLSACLRGTDIAARWGGDEFVLLLPEIDDLAANAAAERLLQSMRLALEPFGGVTATLGVAWFTQADRPIAEMIRAADAAMYDAKEAGRDNYILRRHHYGCTVATASPSPTMLGLD